MSIICQQLGVTITGSNSALCGYNVRISNILPSNPSQIEIMMNDTEIHNVYTSGGTVIKTNEVWTFFLRSKTLSSAVIDFIISSNPCSTVTCPDICVGPDLYSQRCRILYDSDLIPTGQECIQNTLKEANSPQCAGAATHVLEIALKPYSWYTPQSAADYLITKINDINGSILNILSFLTGWSYVGTTISNDGTYVYVRIYMRELTSPVAVQTLSPLTLGQIALVLVAALIIGIAVGVYIWSKWGTVSAPTNTGLSNKDLGDAGDKYMKQQLGDCELKICTDPTLTQDQKALCITQCYDANLENWKSYQGTIFPGADHTPLDKGRAEVQKCYDAYNITGKTVTDYQALLSCMQLKGNEAVTGDTNNTYIVYPPDSPAGVTAKELAGDCWIPSPVGGCILSAKTGKTFVTAGIVAGVIYIGYRIVTARR